MQPLMWLLIVIVFLVLLILIIFYLSYKIRSGVFKRRYDDDHTLHYFTADDFENLVAVPYSFRSKKNQELKGYLYHSSKYQDFKALLIFSHGLGAGHLQYTTEINYFAQNGYLVLGFDYTGCNLSEGKCLGGFSQAIIDLDYAVKAVEKDEKLKGYKKVIYGHSMGAFAANNITRFSHDIIGIVSMSSFNKTYALLADEICARIGKKGKIFLPGMKLVEKAKFKKVASFTSLDSFKKSTIPTLIVHGVKDQVVAYEKSFAVYQKELKDKENFRFLSVENRYHRPNLTLDAAEYAINSDKVYEDLKVSYLGKIPEEEKKNYFENLDYKKLTDLDLDVMRSCLDFFDEVVKNNK